MPYYLVNARGLSSGLSGVLLSIIPLTMVIFGPIGGVLADKFNSTKITIIGVTLVLLAQFLIMLWAFSWTLRSGTLFLLQLLPELGLVCFNRRITHL